MVLYAFAKSRGPLMNRFRRTTALLLVLTVFAVHAPSVSAFADGKKESEQARHARSEGIVALNLGHYDDAADHFEDAYALNQDPILLYYLGQAYRLGGKLEKALAAYNSFLRTVSPSSKNYEPIERAAADIENIATTLSKRGAMPPRVDPVPEPPAAIVKRPPPPPLDISEFEPEEKIEPVKEANAVSPPPLLPAPPVVVPTESPQRADLVHAELPPPPAAAEPSRFYKKWWFWSSVAGVLAVGGVTAWWYTRSSNDVPASTWGYQRVLP
jgi:Tetratricopeptide repeat